jgi:SecD/SecF fusion protein
MAVDANILVFERVKEEIKSGKKLQAAIELGFRRALPAIIDSNACTILTSLVLYNLGTGPVKGFATTLIIGVLISLFTAVTVTRSLLMFFVGSGIGDHESWYAVNRNWFGKKFDPVSAEPLEVVQKAKKWFAISLVTIIVSIPFFFMGGFKLNVEFQGGYQAGYSVKSQSVDANLLSANLEKAGFKGGNVRIGSAANGDKHVDLTVLDDKRLTSVKTDVEKEKILSDAAGLNAATPISFNFVGPAIQKETLQNAIEGVIISSILVVLYLAVRFGTGFGGFGPGMRFGVSAIGALVHDILVVIGTAAIVGYLFKWEVSALFLTAMLTMIGFSVHDTIVIFDRIRENLRRPKPGEDLGHLMNRSITQSFARSINTSGTVIATLLILVVFGTPSVELKFFVLTMMIGIISGTYSSIYNASPILYLWDKAIEKSKGADHTLIGMANAEHLRHQVISTRIAEPEVPQTPGGRTYGQVRRRANQPKPGHIEVEDEN